ncbi:MAG TPA: non-homologous end-joining DNA ligase [Streptosporangiaceae bacterium]|nr:non-homologous end-joining DNA ligase [Streptosporangiaceae bacterium]
MTPRQAETITVSGIRIDLSHTAKVFFSDPEITKGDLVGYYRDMADRILPYLRKRPLVMERYPDGISGQRIVQKNVPSYFPDWVTRTEIRKQGGSLVQILADKPATLVYLANQGCVEMHGFLSRIGSLDHPDQLIFDLDPPDGEHFGEVRRLALELRELLEGELGLTAFVKTTGGRGLHVHVPLAERDDFDTVRGFARQVSEVLAAREPDRLTTQQRREGRGDRVYADVMRNSYAQTAVTPFSVRARPGAPVATPLGWDELDDPDLTPLRFTLRTVGERLDRLGSSDPWSDLGRRRYGLARPAQRLEKLAAS